MRILLVGGAASGKSSLAEALAVSFPGRRAYIATMRPMGAEGRARVERHRRLRAGKGFATIERYSDLSSIDLLGACGASADRGPRDDAADGALTVLLECVCNLVANELYDDEFRLKDAEAVFASVIDGLAALSRQADNVVVVTNDVGSDGISYPGETQAYVSMIGRVNCAIAAAFDVVVEVAGGVPTVIKGPQTAIEDRLSHWGEAS